MNNIFLLDGDTLGLSVKNADEIHNKIILWDSLAVMKKMPSESLDLVVTSPPYNLKNSTGNGMKDGREVNGKMQKC